MASVGFSQNAQGLENSSMPSCDHHAPFDADAAQAQTSERARTGTSLWPARKQHVHRLPFGIQETTTVMAAPQLVQPRHLRSLQVAPLRSIVVGSAVFSRRIFTTFHGKRFNQEENLRTKLFSDILARIAFSSAQPNLQLQFPGTGAFLCASP